MNETNTTLSLVEEHNVFCWLNFLAYEGTGSDFKSVWSTMFRHVKLNVQFQNVVHPVVFSWERGGAQNPEREILGELMFMGARVVKQEARTWSLTLKFMLVAAVAAAVVWMGVF